MITLSREFTIALNKLLNDVLPQYIRDRKWFGWCITRLVHGKDALYYMQFNDRAWHMSDEEIAQIYAAIGNGNVRWESCLTQTAMQEMLGNISGSSVLEIGCGKGKLTKALAKNYTVTACDIVISETLRNALPNVTLVQAPAENLPFPDQSFDTVISSHVIEHSRDLQKIMHEHRRLCRKRIMIVVPCERPHRYTLNLHLNFFPYRYSLLFALRPPKNARYTIKKVSGDWLYMEENAM